MPLYNAKHYPERFIELKKSIVGDEATLTKAWAELLAALKDATAEYASKGPSMIPIVEFDQLETLGRSAFPPRPRHAHAPSVVLCGLPEAGEGVLRERLARGLSIPSMAAPFLILVHGNRSGDC